MANLTQLIPGGGSVEYKGVVVDNGAGVLSVNVMGNTLPCRFADPVTAADGDPVLVTITGGAKGGYEAIVRSRITEQPRPAQGKVKIVPAGSATITVTGSDGTDYTATFLSSYTPAVNDQVILTWNAGLPTVLAKVGSTPVPTDAPPPPPPPPAPPQTGKNTYAATDSATWSPQLGVWDAWAGGGGNVYQGTWGGYSLFGAWFYNGSPTALAGRTLTKAVFRLGSRRQVGNYNSPATVHLYTHTSRTRPGGDVSRGSSFDVVVQPGSGPVDISLPSSFFASILAGGGIGVAGDPYAGFMGRRAQPDSGTLTLYWTR